MEVLQKLGLNASEVKVYVAIGELGQAPIGGIITRSGVPSSHIYPVIDSLSTKGLISYAMSGKRKTYSITSPRALKELIAAKQEELERLEAEVDAAIPLLSVANLAESKEVVVYEGIPGIKTAIENMLKNMQQGDTYYVLGAPVLINKRLNGFFLDVHERRVAKGIKYRVIYNADALEFAKQRKKQALTEVRVQSNNVPVEVAIYGDIVQFIFLEGKYRLIEMNNKLFAKTMQAYFEMAWSQSKKL